MKRRRLFVAIDLSKYRGRYIALVRREIVASGSDAEKVWLEAKKKYPQAQPELLKVSKGETLVLIVCG
jgi:dihydroxyacetone kinase-like predicted kinase